MNKIGIKVKDSEKESEFNIEEIMEMVNEKYNEQENNMDNYIALEIDYHLNFIKTQLVQIAKYYNISVRKKIKAELVQDLVIFELDPQNIEIVSKRKHLWNCIDEIKGDKYLSKFLNIST